LVEKKKREQKQIEGKVREEQIGGGNRLGKGTGGGKGEIVTVKQKEG
jgi:hypothetical protein